MKLFNRIVLGVFFWSALANSAQAEGPLQDESIRDIALQDFPLAETHFYMSRRVNGGGLGDILHNREFVAIDQQRVVRMNRDTLASSGVFDLSAGDVRVFLPETHGRYLSLQAISENHYTVDVAYEPGEHVYTEEMVGSRYVYLIVRTLADPTIPGDVEKANGLQDAIVVKQKAKGEWQAPNWDAKQLSEIRKQLKVLASTLAITPDDMFGKAKDVDPISHLLGSAGGWGGLPKAHAIYKSFVPEQNDGKTPHTITLRDVPVEGFWSVSVYNESGYFVENDQNAYSINSLTAKPNADGSYTIQLGGDINAQNYIATPPNWNYNLRFYQPRKALTSGQWTIPQAVLSM